MAEATRKLPEPEHVTDVPAKFGSSSIHRLMVPGGWIVVVTLHRIDGMALATSFVPDPGYAWELE